MCALLYSHLWKYVKLQCYYLGGLEDSATGILNEMSKPLSWSMPALKVCERLKKMDAQVCDIKYGMFVKVIWHI